MADNEVCRVLNEIANNLLKIVNKADGLTGKVQGLVARSSDFLDGLPPTIPSVPKPDLDVLEDLKAACPFIIPFIPDWYNESLNSLAEAQSLADSFLGQIQGQIDLAANSLLGPVTSELDNIVGKLGELRNKLGLARQALESIIRCMEELCSASTANYWKSKLDDIRDDTEAQVDDWIGNKDESIWKGNFVSKQTSKKVNAYKSYAKESFSEFGSRSSIDSDPLKAK